MQGRGNLFAVDQVALRKFLTKAQMGTLTVNIPGVLSSTKTNTFHLSPFTFLLPGQKMCQAGGNQSFIPRVSCEKD